jgi:hypothetical protein
VSGFNVPPQLGESTMTGSFGWTKVALTVDCERRQCASRRRSQVSAG